MTTAQNASFHGESMSEEYVFYWLKTVHTGCNDTEEMQVCNKFIKEIEPGQYIAMEPININNIMWVHMRWETYHPSDSDKPSSFLFALKITLEYCYTCMHLEFRRVSCTVCCVNTILCAWFNRSKIIDVLYRLNISTNYGSETCFLIGYNHFYVKYFDENAILWSFSC